MARIRMIKPAFFDDPDLAAVLPLGRLLFIGLWTLADKAGRLEDDPRRIKVRVLPFDDCDVDALLGRLDEGGFIIRYSATDGSAKRYLQIRSFAKHQRAHPKEPESEIPAPTASELPGEPGKEPAGTPESGIRNLEYGSKNVCAEPQTAPTPPAESEPVFATFTVKGGTQWQLSEARVAEWATAFRDLDVPAALLKARGWVDANEGRRKTAKGMGKFLYGWLLREARQARASPRRADGIRSERLCPHDPCCRSFTACRDRILADGRAQRAAEEAGP